MGIASRETGALSAVEPHPVAELRELRVFLILAEELHFGRAAERLHINRSRVSQIINTLEIKLGGRLFERTSRRVRLTPAAERLLANLAPAYQDLALVLKDTRDSFAGVAGTLRIGMYTPANLGRHMVSIVSTFEARHPGAQIEFVHTGLRRDYLHVLREGEVDVTAARLPLSAPDIAVGPVLSHDDRILLLAKRDPLSECESVSIEDLEERGVSYTPELPREMMDAFVPPVTPSGRLVRRIASYSIEEVMIRVALGEQVHLTVRSFVEHLDHPGIASVPVRDLPPSETALAWLAENHSPKIQALARAAHDVLAQTELAAYQPTSSVESVARVSDAPHVGDARS